MTVGELLIKLGYKTDESSKSKVQGEATALKSTLKKILGTVGIAFSVNGVKNFIQESTSAYADFKATATQFGQTFEGMEETASAALTKVSQDTGISENRMKQSFTRMAAFAMTTGMEMGQATDFTSRAMEALADNAAYFDKSIEYTQETFQKLLKGNFTLDDNLGFNLAEGERNKMAQEMYGASSYNDLEEWQKQELILEKLIEANNNIGATGQAASEAGEYTNQVGELSDAVTQFKVAVGSIFLEPTLKIMTALKDVAFDLADALGDVEEQGTFAYRAKEKLSRAADKLVNGFTKIYNFAKKIVTAFGGLTNIIKLLGIIIGVVLAYKLTIKLLTFHDTLKKVATALSKVNWRALAVIASIVLLVLVIQDLVYFVQGKDSLFGRLLDKAGIDPEPIRKAFQKVVEVIQTIGQTVSDVFGAVKDAIGGAGIDIDLQTIIEAVVGFIAAVGAVKGIVTIIQVVVTVFGVLKGAVAAVSAVFAVLSGPVGIVIAIIAALIAVGVALYMNWDTVKQKASELWDAFVQTGEGIAKGMTDGLNAIIDAGQDVIDFFTDLVSDALTWGSDLVNNFIGGIGDFAGKVAGAVGGGIQWLADNMKHSVPKKGPLKDDDKWMPDMMDNFVNGIEKGKSRVKDAVNGVAGVLADGKDGLMALGANINVTGESPASANVGRNITINQYNTFANTFNGDTRQNQVDAGKQLKNNATDTTTYLANAIAFGR